MLVVQAVGPKTGACFAHQSLIHFSIAKICDVCCNFLTACQLHLPHPLFHSKSFLKTISRRDCWPCVLEQPWAVRTGPPMAAEHMYHWFSLNCMFFFLIPTCSTYRHYLHFIGVLRVNITDLSCSTCLFSIHPYNIRWQEIISIRKSLFIYLYIFGFPINSRNSFLKLMGLIDILLLQVKSSCWINGASGHFKEDLFLSQLGSFLGVLSPVFSTFDFPPLKIGYSKCHRLSLPWMLSIVLFMVFSQTFSSSSTFIDDPRSINHLLPYITCFLDCFDFPPFVAVTSELHISDLPFPCLCHGCRISLWTVTPSR